MKRYIYIFVIFCLFLSGCATLSTPTQSEVEIQNEVDAIADKKFKVMKILDKHKFSSEDSEEMLNSLQGICGSKDKLLNISADLRKKIYELDQKETFSRTMAWITAIGTGVSVLAAILTPILITNSIKNSSQSYPSYSNGYPSSSNGYSHSYSGH